MASNVSYIKSSLPNRVEGTDLRSSFFHILPDGRFCWTRDDSLQTIHITTPHSLLTSTISTHGPVLVGDRFLISQASPSEESFRWYDLQDPTLKEHQTELTTYHSALSSIPGSKVPFFYDLYVPSSDTVSASDSATSETESEQSTTTTDISENLLPSKKSNHASGLTGVGIKEPANRMPTLMRALISLLCSFSTA